MTPAWREHPKLHGRFHPEHLDDLEVIVHEGGPLRSDRRPELVRVRVTGCEKDVFSGMVLNRPFQLRGVEEGSQILFVVPETGDYPLQVSSKYLEERSSWRLLMPCKKCGLSELFDPPSELVATSFPSMNPEELSHGFTFTTRCGWCGGGVVVRLKRAN